MSLQCSQSYTFMDSFDLPKKPMKPLLGIYTQEKLKSMSLKNLYTNAHSSIIHNIQTVETTQMPINQQMDKSETDK